MCIAVTVQPNTIVRIIYRTGVSRWRIYSARPSTVECVCGTMTGSCQQPPGNAVKGCGNVGSRVRVAAAACFVASGLLAGGASVSMAFADSPLTGADSGDKHTDGSGPKSDPTEKKTGGERSTSEEPATAPATPRSATAPATPRSATATTARRATATTARPATATTARPATATTARPATARTIRRQPRIRRLPRIRRPPTTPTPTPTPTPTQEPPPPTDDPCKCKDEKTDHCSPGSPWWSSPGVPRIPPESNGGFGGSPEVPPAVGSCRRRCSCHPNWRRPRPNWWNQASWTSHPLWVLRPRTSPSRRSRCQSSWPRPRVWETAAGCRPRRRCQIPHVV